MGNGITAAGSAGNCNTGTLNNGPVWTTGQTSGGLDFDGADDYVEVPDSGASLSLWRQHQPVSDMAQPTVHHDLVLNQGSVGDLLPR